MREPGRRHTRTAAGGSLLSEGIARLRRGEVIRDAGYDGEYGTIRLFQPGELQGTALFAVDGLAPAGPDKNDAERTRVTRTSSRPERRREGAATPVSLGNGQRRARNGIAPRWAGSAAACRGHRRRAAADHRGTG